MIDTTRMDKTIGDTLPKMFRKRRDLFPDNTLQASRNQHGRFDRYSYTYVYERVIEMAVALKDFGIKRGDLVGIMADNRREWLVTDMALLCLGAADVPRGCDSTGVEMRFILNYTECKVCFFENSRQLDKVLDAPPDTKILDAKSPVKSLNIKSLKDAILFDPPTPETLQKAKEAGINVHNFWDFEIKGKHSTKQKKDQIEKEIDKTTPQELATIIFTSGTTGTPKGVMLSHDNFIAQAEVVHTVLPDCKPGHLWLSVLPVWHSFERAFVYLVMVLGAGYAYSKPVASLMLNDMALLKPEWMCAVPRLWESMARGFMSYQKKQGGLSYTVFNIFIWVGKQYSWGRDRVKGLICHYKKYPRAFDFLAGLLPFLLLFLPHLAGEFLVYRKVRLKLGGNMIAAISGGGSLQPSTDAFYHAIGFNLLEGYGMTETAPVLSVRNSSKPRFGCVGEVFPCVDLKVVPHQNGVPLSSTPLKKGKKGLILAKGRQVMLGYYKQSDLTSSIISKDGWLNTGDIGVISYDEEIKITGRAKDTIVLLGGENVEPVFIEKAITLSPVIQTAVVLGQDKRSIAALIVPQKDAILAYATENHIVWETYEALLDSSEIKTLIRQQIDSLVCAKTGFRPCERISSFCILKQEFQVGKELNAKQELMRYKINKLYARQIKKLFK